MTVPGKDEWSHYLAYLYRTYEAKIIPGKPDLTAYEDLGDSESE